VLQPNFVYTLGEHMRASLSDEQLAHYMPFRSLLAAGVTVALSADGHPQNPLYGIMGSVWRKTEQGNPLGEAESVSVMEALRAYTRTSAYSLFEEDRRGSLEAGKVADLIVLDRDIRSIPPEQIKDVQVLLTIKDGRIAVDRLKRSNGGR
jgi:predicted amidohydrolase YtcJ